MTDISPLHAQILRMAADGVPPRDIHASLGGIIQKACIYQVLIKARRRGLNIPRFPTRGDISAVAVTIPTETVQLLRAAAVRRRITVSSLVRRIVEVIAREGFVDSVLDDGA